MGLFHVLDEAGRGSSAKWERRKGSIACFGVGFGSDEVDVLPSGEKRESAFFFFFCSG